MGIQKMKKLFTIILVASSGIVAAQPSLGIHSLNQFPSTIVNGVPYQLAIYIVNEGSSSFSGQATILMNVNNSTSPFVLAYQFNVYQALGNNALAAGDSILWTINNFIFPTSSFHAGVNDILIWPEAPGIPIGDKYIGTVNYISSPIMRDNHSQFSHYQPPAPSTRKKGNQASSDPSAEISNFSLDVFPNPATSFLSVNSTAEGAFTIVSSTGQVVGQFSNPKQNIDISTLPQGCYFIRFVGKSGEESVKSFLKQ